MASDLSIATTNRTHQLASPILALILPCGEEGKPFGKTSTTFTIRANTDLLILLLSPGRFYISVVAKMILSEFILHYDLKLESPSAPRSLAWGNAQIPHPLTRLLIRKRVILEEASYTVTQETPMI